MRFNRWMEGDAVVDEMLTETLTDAQGADWTGDGEEGALRERAGRTMPPALRSGTSL